MNSKALITRIIFLLIGAALIVRWFSITSSFTFVESIDDSYMETALNFAHAVYVKDWDGVPERFENTSRTEDGSYYLNNPNSESAQAFNRLAKSGWHIYFTEIGAGSNLPQDAQILTGSRIYPGNKIKFVVAFRGSDKHKDYILTNFKSEPTFWDPSGYKAGGAVGFIKVAAGSMRILDAISMGGNSLVSWSSNLLHPASPVFVHRGFLEQVVFGLSANIIDPVEGTCFTVLDALDRYPDAEFIITGHSSGGGDANVLSALAEEMGLNQHKRIRTRTFAAAGAFNAAGHTRYKQLDSINYVIAGDPILYVNAATGYAPLGVNVILSATPNNNSFSRTIHEMTAYQERLAAK